MKNDNQIYNKEELNLIKEVESGNYEPLSKKDFDKEKNRFQEMASNTLKRKSINIRVFESDIDKIKAIALGEGIPYQTFITSLIHKVASGKTVNYEY